MKKSISIIIPVHNNEKSLNETCLKLIEVYQNNFSDLNLEILFVNDGSRDNSWKELIKLKNIFPQYISLINLSRNFGQLGALHAGFAAAQGDAVACVSADLQDPIQLIAEMVNHWRNDIEIVICHRKNREDGFFRKIFSNFAYYIARFSSPELPKGGFDYWLMSKRVCKMLSSFKGRHNFLQGYLLSLGFSKVFIPYTRVQRKTGKSGYNLWKKIKIVLDFLVDSSYLPIRFISCVGGIVSLSGLLYSFMIIYAWFENKTPFPGWAPLMIMLLLIGGLLMITLGIIGEYIWRIYDNLKDFPLYIIDQKWMASEDTNFTSMKENNKFSTTHEPLAD